MNFSVKAEISRRIRNELRRWALARDQWWKEKGIWSKLLLYFSPIPLGASGQRLAQVIDGWHENVQFVFDFYYELVGNLFSPLLRCFFDFRPVQFEIWADMIIALVIALRYPFTHFFKVSLPELGAGRERSLKLLYGWAFLLTLYIVSFTMSVFASPRTDADLEWYRVVAIFAVCFSFLAMIICSMLLSKPKRKRVEVLDQLAEPLIALSLLFVAAGISEVLQR